MTFAGALAAAFGAGLLALPATGHASNSPFVVPLVIEAAQPVQAPVGLHQTARLLLAATPTEDVVMPKGLPIKAGEILVGGSVGQGVMFCASPQKPAFTKDGSFDAVCFRDTTNSGVFDLMASQYQEPERANTVIEAGFSNKMHWEPVHVAYKKLAPNEGPEITLEVKGSSGQGLLGGPKVFVDYRVCFPPGMHHYVKKPDDVFCGIVRFDRRFFVDPYGTHFDLAKGGEAQRFTNGPVEVDFALAQDGAVIAKPIHALPEGPALLAISGQIRGGYARSQLEATIFEVQPVQTVKLSPP